jgi:hypothetical protein
MLAGADRLKGALQRILAALDWRPRDFGSMLRGEGYG